jgi:hypothetical protein
VADLVSDGSSKPNRLHEAIVDLGAVDPDSESAGAGSKLRVRPELHGCKLDSTSRPPPGALMQHLTYGTKTIGEIEIAIQGAQPAIWGHMVNLQLTGRLPAADGDACALEVAAIDVYMGGKWLGSAMPFPGQAVLSQRTYASTEYTAFRLFLEPLQVQAVEELRNGGGLNWRLQCSYRMKQSGIDTILSDQEDLTIAQGVWVPLLEQMGYQRTLLLEIPIPDARQRPELAQAVALLARSQKLIAEGQYTEAVGMCRDVLEEVSRALKDENGDGQVPGLFQNTRQMTKVERLQLLRRATKVLTHPARHRDEVAVAIEWSRIDALSIATITAALIQELSVAGAV